ncbi:hypothetical protein [Brevundimonas sp. SORGH_AS_0993]|uniref:hypothetical protein n=1 Tax=Brevundimonas sp. SORGH_AS_0993 TaxID=3041794 RepID=UPI00278355D2|nr:hypothetical protein [Brevundimonas sp. SORGH_AS_0993]MDQ1155043.1 hypothetical protein [Brevundimonas sp. SORGH_AS_0993]
MTDGVRPVGGPERVDRRESERRRRDRRVAARALVAVSGGQAEEAAASDPARPAVHTAPEPVTAAFVAQQIGQGGQKRGLRGGAPVLDAARAAYLGTEYSGAAERRPPAGKSTKTEI